MNVSQLSAWCTKHRVSSQQLAVALGISNDDMSAWEEGRTPIPAIVDLALAALDFYPDRLPSARVSLTAASLMEMTGKHLEDPDHYIEMRARESAVSELRMSTRYLRVLVELDRITAEEGHLTDWAEREGINPIIARFGGWAVTTYGIEEFDSARYWIEGDDLRGDPMEWVNHMREKALSSEELADVMSCIVYILAHPNIDFAPPVERPISEEN
jgi:transcriptional regulator with XRE-family HTH domain